MNHIQEIVKHLNLEKHCEGGYFKETYRATATCLNPDNKERTLLTSIYYLVTHETGMSCFAINKADLILYHHAGDPLKIIFLDEQGNPYEEILGSNLSAGEKPQIICPANAWKAYDLMSGEYALVSEAVAPGFEYEDMSMPTIDELKRKAPKAFEQLKKYVNAYDPQVT